MRITLLVVGKTIKGWTSDGLEVYRSRLQHYVNFEIKEISASKVAPTLSKEEIKRCEGELILKALRPDDRVVLLDEHGEERTSLQWSKVLQQDLSRGQNMVYVIGGAYGFSPDVYARADAKMSLSKMTFSHQMVRIFFAEQLYRAFTIIGGEPYHNE